MILPASDRNGLPSTGRTTGDHVDVGGLEPDPVPGAGQPDGIRDRLRVRRGLQQQHLAARVLAEPGRGDAAARAAPR